MREEARKISLPSLCSGGTNFGIQIGEIKVEIHKKKNRSNRDFSHSIAEEKRKTQEFQVEIVSYLNHFVFCLMKHLIDLKYVFFVLFCF